MNEEDKEDSHINNEAHSKGAHPPIKRKDLFKKERPNDTVAGYLQYSYSLF